MLLFLRLYVVFNITGDQWVHKLLSGNKSVLYTTCDWGPSLTDDEHWMRQAFVLEKHAEAN